MKERKINKTILLTFDYELFLKESGSLDNCLIKPTEELRKTLNKCNIKATFFIDILYYYKLLQFSELKEQQRIYQKQIRDFVKDGHDIGLHLHPQWLEAVYQNGRWIFPELKIYSLQQLSEDKIDELFKIGIDLLTQICTPVKPDFKVISFRAGGLCITPFDKLKNSFKKFNIIIDSSVAKGLKAESKYQNYNFLKAPDMDYYRFEDNPLIKEKTGNFIELPISVYKINLFDKIIRHAITSRYGMSNNKPFSSGEGKSLSPSKDKSQKSKVKNLFNKILSYKMPFSLDYTQPEFIINKINKSNKNVINFLSHCKFLSHNSLLTIEELAKQKSGFATITQLYNEQINNNKTLILITGHFPYIVDEGYLKEEIVLLSKVFKKIIIVSQDTFSIDAHSLPTNCKVYRVNSTLSKSELIYSSILLLANTEVYSELFEIFKTYKRLPNRRLLVDLFTLINSGNKIFRFIIDVIKKENLLSKDIIVYSYWLDKCAYTVAKLIQANKIKAGISRAHSYDIYLWRNQNNYLPLRRYLYKKLTCIYFISEHGKNYFVNLLKIKNENSLKLRLNKLGVSNNNYQITKKVHAEGDIRYFKILSCSYIMPIKRIKEIIEALSLIDKVNISWVHIGDGSQAEDYASNVKKLAEMLLATKQNIKYQFTGKIPYNDVIKYYTDNQVDIFINVSETEGLPVSIMEAMSFGIPVIATSVGGTPEIVNNTNGILLSENPSTKEITNAIERFCSLSDDEFYSYRQNAYKTWKENYNADTNYNKFVEDIKRL